MTQIRPSRRLAAPALTLSLALGLALAGAAPAAAKGPTAGSWSAGVAVSPAGQPDPTRGAQVNDVAVNASGVTLATWDAYTYTGTGGSTIGAAVETAGRWASPVTVSAAGGFATTPRAAVAPDGTLAVSWSWQDPVASANPLQKVQVAVRPAGAAKWSTATLATWPLGGVQGISQYVPIAFDAAGNLTAIWVTWNGTTHPVQAATLPHGGTWSAVSELDPGFDALFPALAANAAGDVAAAWSTSPYNAGTTSEVRYALRHAGAWAAPQTVSGVRPRSTGSVSGAMVGLDAKGLATVAWFGAGVEATRQTSPTTWTTPATVLAASNAVSSYMSPDMATDGNGNSYITAAIFDATVGVDRASAWVVRGTAAGAWSPQVRLTDPTVPVDAYATRVAASPDGGLALVSWVDHYHGVAGSARYDAASGTWLTTTIGRGSAFSSFQEVMGLDAASSTVARVVWKVSKGSTYTYAADFHP